MDQTVKVGVGVVIFKDGKILLGKRKGSHGAGGYGAPGGHQEYGETLAQTAIRETTEECGITIKNLRMICVSDLLKYLPKHYTDIGFYAEWVAGTPRVLEPEKCEGWDWYDPENLPENVFGCLHYYLRALKTGEKYFTVRD